MRKSRIQQIVVFMSIMTITACSGSHQKSGVTTVPEGNEATENPQQPNGWSAERGYYHSDVDCGTLFSKMTENEGNPEALRYMTPDCCGNPEYAEYLWKTLGVSMRENSRACIDYIENELIKNGDHAQARFLLENMKSMYIVGKEEFCDLVASIGRARDGVTKQWILSEVIPVISASLGSELNKYSEIEMPNSELNDIGKQIHTGKLLGAEVVKVHETELIQAVIDVQEFGKSQIIVSNDLKTWPEMSAGANGLIYFNSNIGKTVWFQVENVRSPDGTTLRLMTDLVVYSPNQFADFVCDNASLVFAFLKDLTESARATNTQFLAEMIVPFEFQADGKKYAVLDMEDALNAVPIVFNNKVKNAIVNQSIAKLTANQYGIMLGEGEVWINYNIQKKKMEIMRINPL